MLHNNKMLENFGLTITEEKVYLALLKLGSSPAASIIKKTQLHRTTVYDVLDRLIEKGLVGYIVQDKLKHYSATNPSKFLDLALEEATKANEKQKLAKEIIKKIGSIKEEQKVKQIAQVYIGTKGVKTVMNDIIETGKDFMILGGGGRFKDELPVYTKHWANQRRKKNIRAKIIFTKGSDAPKWEMNEIRYIPKTYQSPTTTHIYGNKIAIFIQEEPILIILIESENVAKGYRNYFNLLWKTARK